MLHVCTVPAADDTVITYPDPSVEHRFQGSINISGVTAIRSFMYGSGGSIIYSKWTPTSDNVKDGHDLDASLALLAAGVAASPFPCYELFPVGTHNGESSLSDQQIACESALRGGQSLRGFLGTYVKSAAGKEVTQLLVRAGMSGSKATAQEFPGLDYGSTLPSPCRWSGLRLISCDYPSAPTTVIPPGAPPRQDPTWHANQGAKSAPIRLPDQPAVPAPGPVPAPSDFITNDDVTDFLRDQCEADMVLRGQQAGISDDSCSTMPIYGTGSDTPQATAHDKAVILANPNLMKLTYVKGSEKSLRHPSWAAEPECQGQAAGMQCDEYPCFSSEEGWPADRPDLKSIPGQYDNARQGGYLVAFYTGCQKLSRSARGSADREF